MPIFRSVVGKRCLTSSCSKDRRPLHEGFCEKCGQSLEEVRGLDLWRVGFAACGLAILLMVATLAPRLLETISRARPAPVRTEVGPAQIQDHESVVDDRPVENRQSTDATAWANLGLAYALGNRPDEALRCYHKALQLDPGHWLAHYNLGLFWARRGDQDRALGHLTQAFAGPLDPSRRQDLVRDLQSVEIPAGLREDPRFTALLAGSSREEGR